MNGKLLFITGGVVSSLGKGIAAASIGRILKLKGFSVNIKKLDPYLNVDPGTMNPLQHGEVFVTKDGGETDLDLGHYERFASVQTNKASNITAGQIYKNLIKKERRGDYLGATVQVVPHVTDLIKEFILKSCDDYDFTIIEIGGTVGDIEGQPFLESIRQIGNKYKQHTMFIHLTLLPYIETSNELKTKPTQHSVRDLLSAGISTDLLLCRTKSTISPSNIKKIAMFCNVEEDCIIEAPDVGNIYEIPDIYDKNGLGNAVLKYFSITPEMCTTDAVSIKSIQSWNEAINIMNGATRTIKVVIAGKYTESHDCYKSLVESVKYAGIANEVKICILWINTREIDGDISSKHEEILNSADCIIVPGGFGSDGIEGKIDVIKYAREHNKPFLGICLGMQLAVIEFARNVLQIEGASSSEFNKNSDSGNIVDIINKNDEHLGGTMRLGNETFIIDEGTLAHKIYQNTSAAERHRHRYEVILSKQLHDDFTSNSGIFSSFSEKEKLPEIFEIKGHPFFLATQFHPEYNSSIEKPNKVFVSLIRTCI